MNVEDIAERKPTAVKRDNNQGQYRWPSLIITFLRYTFETIRTYLTYKLVLKRSLINKT